MLCFDRSTFKLITDITINNICAKVHVFQMYDKPLFFEKAMTLLLGSLAEYSSFYVFCIF